MKQGKVYPPEGRRFDTLRCRQQFRRYWGASGRAHRSLAAGGIVHVTYPATLRRGASRTRNLRRRVPSIVLFNRNIFRKSFAAGSRSLQCAKRRTGSPDSRYRTLSREALSPETGSPIGSVRHRAKIHCRLPAPARDSQCLGREPPEIPCRNQLAELSVASFNLQVRSLGPEQCEGIHRPYRLQHRRRS